MKTLAKFLVEFKTSWHLTIEYRISVFIWMIAIVLPLVMLAAWLSIAEGGPVAGFGRQEFIAYYVAAVIVRNLTGVWIIWEMDSDIRLGLLSFKLLKPMNPIVHYMALSVSSKPMRVGILIPVVAAISFLVPGVRFVSDPVMVFLFLVAIVGTWLILFLMQYINGLLGFWITQSLSINDVWFMVYSLMSGYLIPFDLLPPVLRDVLYASPFRYMMSFPIEIFINRLSIVEILKGLALQWFWVAVFYGLYRFTWARGLRQYSAVGA